MGCVKLGTLALCAMGVLGVSYRLLFRKLVVHEQNLHRCRSSLFVGVREGFGVESGSNLPAFRFLSVLSQVRQVARGIWVSIARKMQADGCREGGRRLAVRLPATP